MDRLSVRIGGWTARFKEITGPTRVLVDPDTRTVFATADATFDLCRQAIDAAEAEEVRAALAPPRRVQNVA